MEDFGHIFNERRWMNMLGNQRGEIIITALVAWGIWLALTASVISYNQGKTSCGPVVEGNQTAQVVQ
jgi:hypothetical protein